MTKVKRKRASHAKRSNARPKGAYPLPNGDYVVESVGWRDKRGRRISVRAVHRTEPDAKLIAHVLLRIVAEQHTGPVDTKH